MHLSPTATIPKNVNTIIFIHSIIINIISSNTTILLQYLLYRNLHSFSSQIRKLKQNFVFIHSFMDSSFSTSTPHHHRSSERRTKPTSSPSPLSLLRSPTNCLPLRELLLMSPPSSRKCKPRFDEELLESNGVRQRRCNKTRGTAPLSSPRNSRRSRRCYEVEVREEKENVLVDEVGKQRKRRHKKDRLSLVPFQPSQETFSPSKANSNFVSVYVFI